MEYIFYIIGLIIIIIIITLYSYFKTKIEDKELEDDIQSIRRANLSEKARAQRIEKEKITSDIHAGYKSIIDIVIRNYDLRICPKCYENNMRFMNVSPTGQSITCKCLHCSKEQINKILQGKDGLELVKKHKEITHLKKIIRGTSSEDNKKQDDECTFVVSDNSGAETTGDRLSRPIIPEAVRHEVWRRDGGRCVHCGSQENLEFDHIIPISKGGANTARNIQLLCEACNRKKSDKI